MKFVWQRSEMGGYTPKGIYQQWVLTHILRKSRWGANAKAFYCLVYNAWTPKKQPYLKCLYLYLYADMEMMP